LVPSTNKLYHHKIKVKNPSEATFTEELVKDIYDHHSDYLDNKRIKKEVIKKLLEKLLNHKTKKGIMYLLSR
jgi:hypothetical protein